MVLSSVYLPDGQTLTVTPVFGGLFFKSNELSAHSSIFPAGWTVVIQSEDYSTDHPDNALNDTENDGKRHRHIHPYKKPTLKNDTLFISSISNPKTNDFTPSTSPTRQIAMMLWATLYAYFHHGEPDNKVTTEQSKNTPEDGKPRGDWRISIKREGVFRGRNLLEKLERMGLITSDDSSVGLEPGKNEPTFFTSRRAFWQLSAKLFLFTLAPAGPGVGTGASMTVPLHHSRPSSPAQPELSKSAPVDKSVESNPTSPGLWAHPTTGQFASSSHLPTYFPPPPLQYTFSNGIRHPLRPRPPRQGETFYTRYVDSIGQYLSFRVASLSPDPVPFNGPVGPNAPQPSKRSATFGPQSDDSPLDTTQMSDVDLLHKWMNDARVSKFWGCAGPREMQEKFLRGNLEAKHSFPVIGLWDGKPFGYFEIYWVKEDILGKYSVTDDYDRGVHVIVGEQEFRGKHRLQVWISALVHWMFLDDYRTRSVVLEPRVDNERSVLLSKRMFKANLLIVSRFISHLIDTGFYKEREVTFPHKQSALVRWTRETFEGPAL
jgi:RimJ/RimL family protein N-acetyltransferase